MKEQMRKRQERPENYTYSADSNKAMMKEVKHEGGGVFFVKETKLRDRSKICGLTRNDAPCKSCFVLC